MYMTWHSWGLIVVIMVALRADMPAGITLHDERSWHKESCCRWDRRSWCGVLLRWLAASASTDWLWSCLVAESAVKKRDAHVELQSWNHMQSGATKKKKKKRRWAPISWFTFMQKSFSYVHNCSVQPHYFSVDWADRVICSAIPQKKQVFFPRLCLARDTRTKLLHRDHSLETTPTCSKHRDVQTTLIVWFLLHHIFGVLLFV